jgi:23S rRNA pseudouridine2605 synthase
VKTRLNKILAQAGLASRRGADRLILDGRVAVNGASVREPGTLVDPAIDRVSVDGDPLPATAAPCYILLNKPAGYLSSRSDPRGRPVVTDLLHGIRARVYPVGRLDTDVEGLLLLTNDGALTHRLLHPRYGLPRVYEARVAGTVRPAELARWRAGVVLDDGPARAEAVTIVRHGGGQTLLRLTFREGRKHEVKRYCERLGHPVRHLRRIGFGPLALGALRPGELRSLTAAEVRALRAAPRLLPPGR